MTDVEVREVTCGNCGHHWATKSQRRYTTCPQCMYKVPVLKAQATPSAGKLDTKAIEGWLWNAACSIRGAVDAPKFKDYILPLIFVKRLSDVYDDEIARLTEEFGSQDTALELVKRDHGLVRFYIPETSKWDVIRKHTTSVGEKLTDAIRAIAKENPKLQGVIDIVDFNATVSGQRIIDDTRLMQLLEVLSDPRYRLGLTDVEPDILGRAYEYLLRKFAEGQGSSAGEFFTPKEVGWLIAHLVDPKQAESVYDPACGSAGLLIKCELLLKGRHKDVKKPLQLYGQELNHVTYAMSRMNMIIHDMEGDITIGDTLKNPKFLDGGKLREFDIVVANPMWNQPGYPPSFYENDPHERFLYGFPTANNADWGWIQHMWASLGPSGRMAVVLDTGALSRGSGSEGASRERDIRKKLVADDAVECVVLLPDNLFYNTPAPGIILFLNKSKPAARRGKVLLVNAAQEFEKGRPKNFLPDQSIERITTTFSQWSVEEGLSAIVTADDLASKDFNLDPARYVLSSADRAAVPFDRAFVDFVEKEERRRVAVDDVSRTLAGISSPAQSATLPAGWTWRKVEDCILPTRGAVGKVPRHEYLKEGRYPVVDQGQGLVAGFTNDSAAVFSGKLPVIIFGDHTRAVKYIEFPFVCGADGTKVLVPDPSVIHPEYLYFVLRYLEIPNRGYNRHFSVLVEMRVPIAPLNEQPEIAAKLRAIDKMIVATEEALGAGRSLHAALASILLYRNARVSEESLDA